MYLLLCKPVIIVPQNSVSTRQCRVVQVTSTQKENRLDVELVEAPPINVDPLAGYFYSPENEY